MTNKQNPKMIIDDDYMKDAISNTGTSGQAAPC